MEKTAINLTLFCLPWVQTILGTYFEDRPNFMALDWVTRVNYQPPMMGACVNKGHASHAAIMETREFSINVPTVEMVGVTDYVGIVSGSKTDKSALFRVFYGQLNKAPLIEECPINIECKLVQSVDLPTNTFFIGEMINAYSEERFLTDGKPDAAKIRPFILTMPDNRFWALGDVVGHAWKDGAAFREEMKKQMKTG